jgi:hypothetical protein
MSVLDALQAALAEEHATLWTYGVLGARTSQATSPTLYDAVTAAYRRHRSRRDQLRLMVRDAGGEPVAAAVTYEIEDALVRAPQVQRAAAGLEAAGVETLLALVGQSSGEVRDWALTEATWSAVWQLELGGTAQTWPGAPELG